MIVTKDLRSALREPSIDKAIDEADKQLNDRAEGLVT